MNTEKASEALKIAPLIIVILLSLLALPRKIDLTASDLGRHLKNGEVYQQTGQIISTNFYSYTFPDFPVVNHHWLGGVVFYQIHQNLSFTGLSVFLVAAIFLTIFLAFLAAKENTSAYAALLPAVIGISLLSTRTEIRPEIFSYLFIALYYFLLNKFRKGRLPARILTVIPFIQIMWVNLHIFFVMGWFVIGLFVIDFIIKKEPAKITATAVILTLSIAAGFINPFGASGVFEPFNIFNEYGVVVAENLDIIAVHQLLDQAAPVFFFIVLIAGFAGISTLGVKKFVSDNFVETALFITYGILTIAIFRVITIFGLAVMLLWPLLLQDLAKLFPPDEKLRGFLKYAMLFFAVFLSLMVISAPWIIPRYGFGLKEKNLAAVQFVKNNKLPEPLFNTYDTGGYLIYGLYPDYKVFADNRPEAYPVDFLENDLTAAQNKEATWQAVENKYGFETLIINKKARKDANDFVKRKLADENWIPVFDDEDVLVFVKNSTQNQTLIEKYAIDSRTVEFDEK